MLSRVEWYQEVKLEAKEEFTLVETGSNGVRYVTRNWMKSSPASEAAI
jgi:hypothetical protein